MRYMKDFCAFCIKSANSVLLLLLQKKKKKSSILYPQLLQLILNIYVLCEALDMRETKKKKASGWFRASPPQTLIRLGIHTHPVCCWSILELSLQDQNYGEQKGFEQVMGLQTDFRFLIFSYLGLRAYISLKMTGK